MFCAICCCISGGVILLISKEWSLSCFEILGTMGSTTQYHIPEDVNPQHLSCENSKSCLVVTIFSVLKSLVLYH